MVSNKKKNRTRKRKGRVVIAQNAVIRKRGNHNSTDSIPKAKTELYRDNGANFKITIRKKRK